MTIKKIGFIGMGNMGEALLKGLLENGIAKSGDVLFSEPRKERSAFVRKTYRVRKARDSAELASQVDVIVLAVKPQQINQVLREASAALDRSKLMISVAAGVSLFQIESRLKSPVRLVRAMPNTPALVGEGATVVSFGRMATAADRRFVMRAFGAVGRAVELEENLLDAVTGLSGSGPAYIYTMIQALADGGVRAGLPRAVALELSAQTAFGAAKMVLETGRHPISLRDEVTSPGGTTIEGIVALEEGGAVAAIMAAVDAAARKSRRISEE